MQPMIAPVVVSGLGHEVIAESRTQCVFIHALILAVFHGSSESLTGVNCACEQTGIKAPEPELPSESVLGAAVH
jgi:hypothetical protein